MQLHNIQNLRDANLIVYAKKNWTIIRVNCVLFKYILYKIYSTKSNFSELWNLDIIKFYNKNWKLNCKGMKKICWNEEEPDKGRELEKGKSSSWDL